MKNFIFFVAFLTTFSYSKSQNLQLFYGDTNVTSDTVKIVVAAEVDPSVIHLGVKNSSTTALNVKVKKIETHIINGTFISLCWGVNCYSPTQFITPTAANIPAGSIDESFHGDYTHMGNSGTSVVQFVFFDEANPDDSASVVVEFNLGTVGVATIESYSFSKPYPNPASEIINFDYSAISGTKLYVYNMLGKTVSCFILPENSGKTSISASTLAQGLYFYEFKNENQVLGSGKIIISR